MSESPPSVLVMRRWEEELGPALVTLCPLCPPSRGLMCDRRGAPLAGQRQDNPDTTLTPGHGGEDYNHPHLGLWGNHVMVFVLTPLGDNVILFWPTFWCVKSCHLVIERELKVSFLFTSTSGSIFSIWTKIITLHVPPPKLLLFDFWQNFKPLTSRINFSSQTIVN